VIWATFFTLAGVWGRTRPYYWDNSPDEKDEEVIASSFPLAQVREMIAGRHLWFRQLGRPEWRLLELPTGHWPMFSRPFDLAEVLLRLAPSAVDRGTNLRK
jgi:hypothetical protein